MSQFLLHEKLVSEFDVTQIRQIPNQFLLCYR
jgi:hypothetical protein